MRYKGCDHGKNKKTSQFRNFFLIDRLLQISRFFLILLNSFESNLINQSAIENLFIVHVTPEFVMQQYKNDISSF